MSEQPVPPRTLIHLTDGTSELPPLGGEIPDSTEVIAIAVPDVQPNARLTGTAFLIDADLTNNATTQKLRSILPLEADGSVRVFICPANSRLAEVRAGALGATRILKRPVSASQILECLVDAPVRQAPSVTAGAVALKSVFSALQENRPLAASELSGTAGEISSDIDSAGINNWLELVRQHHSGTYQHCLLVTGIATAFAKKLGFSTRDTTTITLAGLVHDIGKARIPTEILDKPGKLTAGEFTLIKMHPLYGHEFVSKSADLTDDVVDAVRHHHEYLNGSGYPDQIAGRQIRDVTRIVTIADIFGALLERRSYKPPMASKEAFAILTKMSAEGQLEEPLVAAFRMVADEVS
jgi:putative nucleotidyltransferase with HDIG domain